MGNVEHRVAHEIYKISCFVFYSVMFCYVVLCFLAIFLNMRHFHEFSNTVRGAAKYEVAGLSSHRPVEHYLTITLIFLLFLGLRHVHVHDPKM